MSNNCELINTYQVLEHVMGISGLHPHRLDAVRSMRAKLVHHMKQHDFSSKSIVLDIGCGSGTGTSELAEMLGHKYQIIGIDIDDNAIKQAKTKFAGHPSMRFFKGDLKDLLRDNPELKISAAISISVSMFIHTVDEFYKNVHQALEEDGLFIDAPFMFSNHAEKISEKLHNRTYAVCGCNMKMFQSQPLQQALINAGFGIISSVEHDFDLMKFRILCRDYSALYLLKNFCKNIYFPPPEFGNVSSQYLLKRTLKIFIFFLWNRKKYSGGEFSAIKTQKSI